MFGLSHTRIIVLGAVIVSIVAGVGMIFFSSRGAPTRTKETAAGPAAAPGTLGEKIGGLNDRVAKIEGSLDALKPLVDALKGDKKAVAQVRVAELAQKVKEAEKTLASLEADSVVWETMMKELLVSEKGRKLAGEPGRVERLAALLERTKPGPEAVSLLKEQLKAISAQANAAKDKDNGYAPSEPLVEDIDKVAKAIRASGAEVATATLVVKGLLAATVAAPVSEKTLEEAIRDLEVGRANKRVEELAAVRKQLFDEHTKTLLAAQEAHAKKLNDLELEREKIKMETERQKKEQILLAEKKVLDRKKLEARFEEALPEIKSLLMPFIADGHYQPNGRTNSGMQRTFEKKPISLSLLKGAGYLLKSERALQAMYDTIGSAESNDRPLGSFPVSRIGTDAWKRAQPVMQRAQELLNEFGEIMVERKMLSP